MWSFGVILWEISEGKVPYHEMEHPQVLESVCEKNYILPPPKRVKNEELYNIMKLCWNKQAEKRPSFDELFGMLEDLEKKIDTSPPPAETNNDNSGTGQVYFSTNAPAKKDTNYVAMNLYKIIGKKEKDNK